MFSYISLILGNYFIDADFELTITLNLIFIPFVVLFLIFLIRNLLHTQKLIALLYTKCDPYLYTLTIYKMLNFPKARYSKLPHLYKIYVVTALGLTGDFYFAREYLNKVNEEYGKKISKKIMSISKYIEFEVLMHYEYYYEARQVKKAFEEIIKLSKFEKSLLQHMDKELCILDKRYEEAIEFYEEGFRKAPNLLSKVECSFNLFNIYQLLGIKDKMEEAREFVLKYGKYTFYADKCIH